MNRLAIISIMLVALAASQLSLIRADQTTPDSQLKTPAKSSDIEEVLALDEKSKILVDFCIDIRDYVANDLRGRTQKVNDALTSMFQSTKEQLSDYTKRAYYGPKERLNQWDQAIANGQKSLGQKLIDNPIQPSVIKENMKNLASKIMQPQLMIKKGFARAEKFLVERQRSLGRRLQERPVSPMKLFQETYENLSKTREAVKDKVSDLHRATSKQVASIMGDTCRLMEAYNKEVEIRFKTAKSKDASLADVALDQVECLTVSSITNMLEACRSQLRENKN